jgi:hypothetical protein
MKRCKVIAVFDCEYDEKEMSNKRYKPGVKHVAADLADNVACYLDSKVTDNSPLGPDNCYNLTGVTVYTRIEDFDRDRAERLIAVKPRRAS